MRNPPKIAVAIGLHLILIGVCAAGTTTRDLMRASAYQRHGAKAFETGNTKKARRYLTEALGVLPYYPQAHLGLGHIAMLERRFDDALHEYRLAVDGYRQLGDSLGEAESSRYREVQDQISDLRDQITNLASSYSVAKSAPPAVERALIRMEDAIRRLEMVEPPMWMRSAEAPGQLHFFVGNALFRLDRIDDALAAWEKCAKESPEFPVVFNNLAVVYWKKGRIDDARASLTKAESLGFSVNPEFKRSLGLW